mmetsp:Transcript_11453/g.13134  ORF Transcript_11453/g.13134 Transcript_11453/m.13134 type:complete len:426 (+) Transcript_11453:267-1544(+)|eukprot:CAMPEP_0184017514 /NCGR_PEP_ID=MMETSP0954-20121128/7581_1 /TAXON_ID=627963 /ORGANISM="Aplanochytrium sp, Strain PBS07" /LENGTH=425 /DNA_ID=CAMNT_0026298763 /DNA_START=252 /DNA_END=1529 /DNA_ORIENTATION=+
MASTFAEGDPRDVYETLGALGEGSYGSVEKVRHYETGKIYAMKIIDLEEDMTREELLKEIDILRYCTDAFVVDYFEHYEQDDSIFIIMELCDAGSVNDLMQICEIQFEEPVIKEMIASALLGLEYLHANNIIHRDVKAGNLLLTREGQVKLGDFGVSARLSEDGQRRKTVIGTPFWMAPEVIQETPYDGRADIWSLGITLIELADTEPPYANIHPMRAIFMIPNRPPPHLKTQADWSEEMNDFVRLCLKKNPEERPTASKLLEHPFVAETVERLDKANPRGASDILKPLVEENLEEIEAYRKDEAERDHSSTMSSTLSRGNTAVFAPIPRKEEKALPAMDPGDTFIFNPEQIASTLVPSKLETGANEAEFSKYFAESDAKIPLESAEMMELKKNLRNLEIQFQEDIRDLREAYDRRRQKLIEVSQ